MKMAIALLAASFLIVFAITVKAAKIENLDQAQYQLRIVESGQEHEVALQPGAEAADLCKTKCELYIGADPDPYELVSADALVLGGGRLYENDSKDANPDTSTPKPSTTVAAAKAKPAKKVMVSKARSAASIACSAEATKKGIKGKPRVAFRKKCRRAAAKKTSAKKASAKKTASKKVATKKSSTKKSAAKKN
jgi:hypothetical protein